MNDPDEFRTSATLLGQLAGPRDEAAWARFVALYRPMIWRWSDRPGLTAVEREEICEAVLVKLVKEMPRFRLKENGSFRAWLKTVVHNTATDLQRSWAKRPGDRGVGGSGVLEALEQLQLPESIDSLAGELERPLGRNLQRVREAMAQVRGQLKQDHVWEAFWRTAVEEESAPAVAAELGISVANVYVAKKRVITMLREKLGLSGPA